MKNSYYKATGKRKNSIARVFIKLGNGKFLINNKNSKNYFSRKIKLFIINKPLKIFRIKKKIDIMVNVHGGGESGQADAIKHGISKALIKYNLSYKKKLSKIGFLTRDSRVVERKKIGLHKSRKSKQFSKR